MQILNVHRSIDGRKLLINVKFEDKTFSLVNVYAPNNESYVMLLFNAVLISD